MWRTFWTNPVFNQPLVAWDVSSATDVSEMFRGALSFNQPLPAWRLRPTRCSETRRFDHTFAFEALFADAEWRRMKPGCVVHAASLVANGLRRWVPDGWYAENTATFERGLPRRRPNAGP